MDIKTVAYFPILQTCQRTWRPARSRYVRTDVNRIPTTIDISNADTANGPFLVELIIAHGFIFSLSFHLSPTAHPLTPTNPPSHASTFPKRSSGLTPSLRTHPSAPIPSSSHQRKRQAIYMHAHPNRRAWRASWEGEHAHIILVADLVYEPGGATWLLMSAYKYLIPRNRRNEVLPRYSRRMTRALKGTSKQPRFPRVPSLPSSIPSKAKAPTSSITLVT